MKATFLRIDDSYRPKRTTGRSKRGVRVCYEVEGLERLNAEERLSAGDRLGTIYVNIHGYKGLVDVEVYHSAPNDKGRPSLLSETELVNIAHEQLTKALQEHEEGVAAEEVRKAAERRRREVNHLADQLANEARKDALAAMDYEARLEELNLQFEEAFHRRAKELAAEAREGGIIYDERRGVWAASSWAASVVADDIVEDVASTLETMLAPSPRGGLNLD